MTEPKADRRRSVDYQRQEDLDYLADRIADKMQSEFTIPSAIHKAHHDYVQQLTIRQEQRNKMVAKIVESVSIWALVLTIGFVAMAMWEYAKSCFIGDHHHGTGP